MSCTCKIGPGKFEGEPALTYMAWGQMGNSDIDTYDEHERPTSWLRSPLNLDADREVVEGALAHGYCQECVDEAGKEVGGGVAVWEDDQGFVYCKVFETREEFDKALTAAQQEEPGDGREE